MLNEVFRKSHLFVKNNNPAYQRYFIKKEKLEHRLSIILGARGVRKTTTIAQYMSRFDKDKALYVSLDDISNSTQNIYEIAEAFELQGGKLLCLDEIHKYENWSQELKNIYDTFPRLKVIASGSSALQIDRGSHDLSRRAIVYTMVGMSFREFLELHYHIDFEAYSLENLLQDHVEISEHIVDVLAGKGQRVIALFRDYLKFGYYPYYLSMSNDLLFFQTLKQNINVSIESDFLSLLEEKYLCEVGGKSKSFKQIKDIENSFIAADDMEVGFGKKIPLWLFGFLY